MHKLAEKIADCMKAKVEGMGIDNIEGQDLLELGMWTDIIKDLVCYDKDKKIIEAMEEAEDSEESMKYIEMYEDYPEMRRGYRGQPRDSMGRYTSRRGRRGGRRGYEEMPFLEEPPYLMTPEMYREHDPEYWRDMDRNTMGRMYYTEGGTGGSMATRTQGGQSNSGNSSQSMSGGTSSMGGNRGYEESYGNRGGNQGGRDSREGRSGERRKGYMEAKEMGKDKQSKMKELEEYMKELSTDVTEMIGDASPEEKSMLKTKMQTLLQKIQ